MKPRDDERGSTFILLPWFFLVFFGKRRGGRGGRREGEGGREG